MTLLGSALLLSVAAACGDSGGERAFIDWAALRNPILALDDRMLKDVAVVYDPGTREFYVFTSTRFEDAEPTAATEPRSFFRSRDLVRFTPFVDPDLNGSGEGPGSPDVTRIGDLWAMVFQAPSPHGGDARLLRLSRSSNLREWTAPEELAPGVLDPTLRNIDGALAQSGGHFYLGWKRVQTFMVTRSVRPALDGEWLEPLEASADGEWAENYQFLEIDGEWRMIATAYDPAFYRCKNHPEYVVYTCNHEPFIYRMDGSGTALEDWTRWVDKTHLRIPFEDWNPIMHANSAFLADWRRHDGYFYLFYAGSADGESFARRGHGKIGVARSRDLVEWKAAGDTS